MSQTNTQCECCGRSAAARAAVTVSAVVANDPTQADIEFEQWVCKACADTAVELLDRRCRELTS
jgi:hypothetical protein